jgi:hypothetical protein
MPPEAEPADDLRSALAAAVIESEKAAEPAVAEKPKPEPEKPAVAEAPAVEEAAEKPEVEAPEGATDKPEEKEKPDDKLPAETQKALAGWKAADQAMFRQQSPEAQAFLMRRHKEMTADYTKKLQDISRLKTDYEPVDKLFEPYRDVMKQKGFTASSLIESWANVEKKLASGEQGALEVIGGLINGYKVPREKIAELIGIRPQGTETRPAEQKTAEPTEAQAAPVALPPEIMQVLKEIPNIKQAVSGLTAAQRQAHQAAVTAAGEKAMRDIEAFKSETDAKGTLLRPHFEEVEQDMLRLANAAIAAKEPVPTLAALYETAVWANPSTREKVLAAKEQAEQQARADQAKTKAAAAKKAAVSVTGAPGSGQASPIRGTPERSLRDEIEAQLAEQSAA